MNTCSECEHFHASEYPDELDACRQRLSAITAVDAACTKFEQWRGAVSRVQRTQIGGDHYVKHAIQPWDAMKAWMTPEQFKGFLRGNALKYIARCEDKGGVQDIEKAIHYLQRLAEEMRA